MYCFKICFIHYITSLCIPQVFIWKVSIVLIAIVINMFSINYNWCIIFQMFFYIHHYIMKSYSWWCIGVCSDINDDTYFIQQQFHFFHSMNDSCSLFLNYANNTAGKILKHFTWCTYTRPFIGHVCRNEVVRV